MNIYSDASRKTASRDYFFSRQFATIQSNELRVNVPVSVILSLKKKNPSCRSILPTAHQNIAVIKVTGDAELQVLSQIISLIYKYFRRFLADFKKTSYFCSEKMEYNMATIEERYISLLTDFGFKRIFGTAP
ncbi:MAG: hypothetical protein ACI4T5_04360, partial [Prevotella sp.]